MKLTTFKQVKEALEAGKKVNWHHDGYEVIKDSIGQYLIHCLSNDHYSGLGEDYFVYEPNPMREEWRLNDFYTTD